jgi:hypothetical protein
MPFMDCRRALLLLIALALFLGPIAGATIVPDPTWIAGVYDGGDGDEVAILLDNTPGIVPVVTVPLTPASRLLAGAPAVPVVVSRPLPRTTSRAPPQA